MVRLLRTGVVLATLAGAGVWLGSSCTPAPRAPEGALVATLQFGSSTALCGRVVVSGGASEHQSPALTRAQKDPRVAIYRSPELGDVVRLTAQGYRSGDCEGPVQFRSETVEARFNGQVQRVALELRALPELCHDGLDNDADSQADCADPDCAPECDAGVPAELCGDALDNDGDLLIDCADPECGGCDAGVCSDAGACVPPPPEACGDGQDNDGDQLADCADPDCAGVACDGGYCVDAGSCVAPPTELNCLDGKDDDGDGDFDCADHDCLAKGCDDQNVCTTGEVCLGTAATASCGGGTLVSCTSPPACMGAGVCVAPDGGCTYVPTPGLPCDGGFCSTRGSCVRGFPYAPSNFVPTQLTPGQISGPVVLNCHASYDSATDTFVGCPGSPRPTSQTVAGNLRLLAMESLFIPANGSLTLTGDKPVILAVFGPAAVVGRIEAGAKGATAGAGGSSGACGAAGRGVNGDSSGNEGGGAGGGAFGSTGGDGKKSAGGANGGAGGAVNGSSNLVPLRGGCAGGNGGRGGDPGGAGGGAVQISAAGVLRVEGRISAPGGGGAGGGSSGNNRHGGGGGGSGGAILLEGQRLELNGAVVTANGGGGGEGAGQVSGDSGRDGLVDGGTAAPGGSGQGNSNGGNGGPGAARSVGAGNGEDGTGNGAGGAGGGGTGRIRLNAGTGRCSFNGNPVFSPAPSGNGTGNGCPN